MSGTLRHTNHTTPVFVYSWLQKTGVPSCQQAVVNCATDLSFLLRLEALSNNSECQSYKIHLDSTKFPDALEQARLILSQGGERKRAVSITLEKKRLVYVMEIMILTRQTMYV